MPDDIPGRDEIYGGDDDSLYGLVDETLSAGFVELRASF